MWEKLYKCLRDKMDNNTFFHGFSNNKHTLLGLHELKGIHIMEYNPFITKSFKIKDFLLHYHYVSK